MVWIEFWATSLIFKGKRKKFSTRLFSPFQVEEEKVWKSKLLQITIDDDRKHLFFNSHCSKGFSLINYQNDIRKCYSQNLLKMWNGQKASSISESFRIGHTFRKHLLKTNLSTIGLLSGILHKSLLGTWIVTTSWKKYCMLIFCL